MKNFARTIILLTLIEALLFIYPINTQAEKTFNTKQTILCGRLQREIFPGAPNYQSVAQGDQAETFWILKLKRGINFYSCVKTANAVNSPCLNTKNIHSIQLVDSSPDMKWYRWLDHSKPQANQLFAITGQLYSGMPSPHYFTKDSMAIEIKNIQVLQSNQKEMCQNCQ